MNIFLLLKHIIKHPLNRENKFNSIFRFLKWQIGSYFNSFPIVYPITDKANLIIRKGMTGATQNLYCGLADYAEMFFLLHFLRAEDLFIDIGANIGSYSVLASAHCNAKTIAIEPVPATFLNLQKNIKINFIDNEVELFNLAIGSEPGKLKFTKGLDTKNHVIVDDKESSIEVDVKRLDDILAQKYPKLIKIDVEGFETEVIKGGNSTLINKELKSIIIELNGSGSRYGFDENEIHKTLLAFGFYPFNYDPINRCLKEAKSFGEHNTIYIRDINFVLDRVIKAKKVNILNMSI